MGFEPTRRLSRTASYDVSEAGWELDAREPHLLAEAARCADRIADHEAGVEREGVMAAGSKEGRRSFTRPWSTT